MPDAHKNFAYSTVATAPSPATSGTSLAVAAGDGTKFPTPSFNAVVWPAGVQPLVANAEIVRVSGLSTDTLTITRAQEGSSARSVVVGDQIAAAITAKTLTDVELAGYPTVILADSPRGYWRLAESAGTSAADSSGNGNTGTYTGGYTLGLPGSGIGGSAGVLLNGTTGYISVPDAASLDLGDVFTLEAWVKTTYTGNFQGVFAKGSDGYALRLDLVSGKPRITLLREGFAQLCQATADFPTDGLYHHIVATKNGATIKLYQDGIDVTGTINNFTTLDTASPLIIGAQSGVAYPFNGTIDEAAVYSTALSAARIAAHYDAANGKRFPVVDAAVWPATPNLAKLAYATGTPSAATALYGDGSWKGVSAAWDQLYQCTADRSTISTTLVDVTDLITGGLTQSAVYEFEITLLAQASGNTNGIRYALALTNTTGASLIALGNFMANPTNPTQAGINAFATQTAAYVTVTGTTCIHRIWGVLYNTTVAGAAQLSVQQLKVGGAAGVNATVLKGSNMKLRQLY